MTAWNIVWDPDAVAKASRFLDDDPAGLAQLMDAVEHLATDPKPTGSITYGSDDLRRIHLGHYRVLFEIDNDQLLVTIIHVGRIA